VARECPRLQTVSLWIRSKIQFGCIGAGKWRGEFSSLYRWGLSRQQQPRAGTGTEVAAQRGGPGPPCSTARH